MTFGSGGAVATLKKSLRVGGVNRRGSNYQSAYPTVVGGSRNVQELVK